LFLKFFYFSFVPMAKEEIKFQPFGVTIDRDEMPEEICREILRIKGEHNLNGRQITNVQATIELMKKGLKK